ncbi:hypothetical protein DERF_000868 [Dermatophagoides farinae]|uniref:Uncharacterized protein n=1 Tax=Dermatophagoides farinae TaxID=6954 RepID=A0A922IAR6_DERFA|nr:hypothetical protein DERF_000868 [Dermatophagoides farinae]
MNCSDMATMIIGGQIPEDQCMFRLPGECPKARKSSV